MFKSIKDKRLVLTYFGINTDSLTTSLIGVVSQIKEFADSKRMVKKIPVLLAECFQNIVRHGDHDNELIHDSKECFQVIFDQQRIIISSANIIETKKVPWLKEQLEKVNELDKEELKKLRKDVLIEGSFSDKGGAGLGLIEMTYRSGNELQHKFVALNETYSQFFMALTIGEVEGNDYSIDTFEIEYNEFLSKDVLLLYKGDLAWDTSSFIVEMLSENIANEAPLSDQSLKEITVILEVIQNAAKHGLAIDGSKEGVFAVFAKENKKELYCANYIKNEDAALFEQRLSVINGATLEELDVLFKKELVKNEIGEDSNGGLGLLEIARLTNKKLEYSIYEDLKEQLYLSLHTQLN